MPQFILYYLRKYLPIIKEAIYKHLGSISSSESTNQEPEKHGWTVILNPKQGLE